MGTPNFCYENRCVVVTNEDYEMGNVPKVKEYGSRIKSTCRSYNMSEVEETAYPQTEPIYHAIVITAGYYEDACLDYCELATSLEDYVSAPYYYESAKEFVEDVVGISKFNLTEYRVRKLMGKRGDMELEDYLENAIKKIDEWLCEQDMENCENIIDYLKDAYGYEELRCGGVFSNGEAIYTKIG